MHRLFCLIVCLLAAQLRAAPGDLDALELKISSDSGADVFVQATAMQSDGKIIIAGHFDSVLDVPRHNLARLNADGSLDLTFNPQPRLVANPDFDYVAAVAVQLDGRIILSGLFDQVQPNNVARTNLARLNADGSVDENFDPHPNGIVNAVLVQPNGAVVLGGNFTTLRPNGAEEPIDRRYLVRVHADGSLDTTFDPRPNDLVNSIALQTDGKLIIGGGFVSLQPNGAAVPTARHRIARLQSDGTFDPDFDPNANGIVDCVTVQADGRILLGGNFTALQPNGSADAAPRSHLARVATDGSVDPAFTINADSRVKCIGLQANGKILLGGFFSSLNFGTNALLRRQFIARLGSDGGIDVDFDPEPDREVFSVALQADGKILLGGQFGRLQPNGAPAATSRPFSARLLNEVATSALSIPDASQIVWERDGSAPELAQVRVELSTDGGGSWSSLGASRRQVATANWQATGLNLPRNGLARARGVSPAGYQNGSASLFEEMIGFGPDSDNDGLLDSWELQYWPGIFGHSALDDFDGDGICELLEEAFDLNPTKPDAANQPKPVIEGGYLTVTISKQPGVSYQPQTAGTLLTGQTDSFSVASTTVLIDSATMFKVRDNFRVDAGPRRFMRIQVFAAP